MSVMQQDLEAPCHSQLYTIGIGHTIQQIAVGPALHYACREHAYGDCVCWNMLV